MRFGGIVKRDPSGREENKTIELLVKGCNFKCSHCRNYAIAYTGLLDRTADISETIVLSYLLKSRDEISTVVICGGEPTIQDDLPDFLEELKAIGMKVYFKTNGTNPDMLKDIIDRRLADHIFLVLKSSLTLREYESVSGISSGIHFENVLKSVGILRDSGVPYSYCTIALPGIVSDEQISALSCLLGEGSKVYQATVSDQTSMHWPVN